MLLPAVANAAVGHFLFVYGKVSITQPDGTARQATKGAPVEEGETLSSGLHGAAQLRMEDGAFLAIRPNTVLHIDAYAFKEKGRKDISTVSLLKGTFRAITGKIGKAHPQRDLVKTPVATIGIRGTDHEPGYIPPPASGQTPTTPPGAYDKVNKGKTFMRTSAGTLNLNRNNVGYVSNLHSRAKLLKAMPDFYKTPDRAAVKEHKKQDNKSGENSKNGSKDKGRSQKNTRNEPSSAASNSKGSVVTDSSVNNEATSKTTSAGTGEITGTTGAATTTGPTTPAGGPSVLRNYSANSSSGQTLNLTQQTVINGDGTVSNITSSAIPAITYSSPSIKNIGAVSYLIGNTPYTNTISDWWGQSITRDSTGSVTGWSSSARFTTNPTVGYSTATQTSTVTGSGTPSAWNANSYAATGIRYGSYNASAINQSFSAFDPATGKTQITNLSDSLLQNSQPAPFNWITGPGTLNYLPMAYTGNANFSFDGGRAIDQTGSAATLTGSGSVNFANMSVNLGLTATTGNGTWQATVINAPLEWGNFTATNSNNLSLSYSPAGGPLLGGLGPISLITQAPPTGSIRGSLTGKGLTGIASSFAFTVMDLDYINVIASLNGVAAFANTGGAVSTAVNHRWIAISASTPHPATDPYALSSTPQFQYNYPNTWAQAFANNTAGITYNAAGSITGFTAPTPLLGTGLSSTIINNTFTWVVTYYWTQTAAAQMSYAGTVQDTGTDPATGISWGRWSGNISQTLLNNSSYTTAPPTALHYIAGPATNQPVQLPTSGTFSYALAGGTSPTDNLGSQPGTLNSASLKADFTNMKVNVGVSATVANTTLTATGNGIPITGALFHGGKGLSVTCSGTCYSHNQGEIGGSFTGATGNGAAVTYSLGTNNPTGTTVQQQGIAISGVAAFHR